MLRGLCSTASHEAKLPTHHIYFLTKKVCWMTQIQPNDNSESSLDLPGAQRQTLLRAIQTLVSASECGLVSSAPQKQVSRSNTDTSTRTTNHMPADRGSKTFHALLHEARQT